MSGAGKGRFVTELARHAPHLRLQMFDLPPVLERASERVSQAGLSERISLHPGSFIDDPLPTGADLITLVRVLHDLMGLDAGAVLITDDGQAVAAHVPAERVAIGPGVADRIARAAVQDLLGAGHSIATATCYVEGRSVVDDLMAPDPAPGEANAEALESRLPILRFFEFGHLPEDVQAIASPFRRVALRMANRLPASAETAAGLRKLLEAKDCAVRAYLK